MTELDPNHAAALTFVHALGFSSERVTRVVIDAAAATIEITQDDDTSQPERTITTTTVIRMLYGR